MWVQDNRRTLALAAPIIAGHVGQMLMGWADTIMVGRVGVVPLAACAFANTLLMVPLVFGFGVLSAVSVRVSLAFGADEPHRTARALRAGLVVGAGLGVLIAAGFHALLPFLGVFGQPPEVAAASRTYLLLCAWSSVAVFISAASKSFAEALSRPWVPFWLLIASVLLNVCLNWVFIFGNLGAPSMGIEGAGLATLLARIAGAFAVLVFPFVSRNLKTWVFSAGGGLLGELAAILRLGFPVGWTHLAEVSGFAAGSIMMGWIGVEALAAHQIAITCAATTFMFPLGLSQAVSMRIGHARGSKAHARAGRIALGGLGMAACAMAVFAAIFLLGGNRIAAIFSSEAGVVALAGKLLVIAGIFQIFDGLQVVSSGALRGFEDVKVPMLVGVSAYWIFGLPVSYALAFWAGVGAVGVWVGFCLGLAFCAAALGARLVWRVRSGRNQKDSPAGASRGTFSP